MKKTGFFEDDVRNGYYDWDIKQANNSTWNEDFVKFLEMSGVPKKYIGKVMADAYERGRAYGDQGILNASLSLIDIFEDKTEAAAQVAHDARVTLLLATVGSTDETYEIACEAVRVALSIKARAYNAASEALRAYSDAVAKNK